MKKRIEISDEFKWDLEKIYKSYDEWKEDYNLIKEKINTISDYKDKFLNSPEDLYEFMKLLEDISLKVDKLYTYAHLHNDEDTSNTFYQELEGKARDLYIAYSEEISFVEPDMLKFGEDKISSYISEFKELEYFKKDFHDIFRYKDHILSEKEEKLLSTLSNAFSNPEDVFEYLTDTDMKFGFIKDESGEEVELNNSNYSVYLTSRDRRVRKDAFEMMYNTFKQYKNTLAATLSGNVDILNKMAKIRGFSSSLEASLFNEEIDVSIYNNLIDNINNNLDKLYKYFNIKKNILGLDEMHIYDTYAKVVDDNKKKYSFDEAKELVINAVKPLGDEYNKIITSAFSDGWIDIYPNDAKRSGAYSSGCYETLPYLLLNYEGQFNDVSTLAHELGHSVHSYLTRTNNPPITGEYKIFVAEVASLVNELLLAKYMLKNSSEKQEKLAIINNLLDLYKATIYRQVMFAEFERDIAKLSEDGEVLTSELLCDLYYKLNEKYYGKDVVIDKEIQYEWMRIPHFYYNFYVYKYAIGLCCASRIVDNILSEKDGALDKYINFLSSGCRKSPLELLKDTDCDLSNNEVFDSAIKVFNDLLDDFILLSSERSE